MNVVIRKLSENYEQITAIGDGRYYLRGKMHEEESEVIALECVTAAYPTAAEIAKIDADAAAEWTKMSHENVLRIIDGLKQQLADTDYKVIKNSEWVATQTALNGVAPLATDEGWPYDPVILHQERQALRDEINEYEN